MTHSKPLFKNDPRLQTRRTERKEGVGVTGEEVSELQGYVGTAATFCRRRNLQPPKWLQWVILKIMTHCKVILTLKVKNDSQ